ncbi:hypothetical protein SDRG_09907 [Saprolegnia diclina VS20]|uniref:Cwf19-like C-terminal domain-containing protein n=1 Tax=Saprolegnia diclina (strain VS20) TaxID=1156394 RepID=T0QG62_SAPDV|nr:hypothetical protein SDRG_09907 [Saprolegnia diclina VS20]EQC32590.1 hypothetical protein SDRG_09907 [Saprolegnia diclina VS20]|eukprot:XP_008614091.1 hypothetical protein SDRG_09907 [Saprolegnia diclina VS20]
MSSLLSGIRFVANADSDDESSKKKAKKHKKESKKHKKKDAPPSPPAPTPSLLKRDEWMDMDFVSGPRKVELSVDDQRKADEAATLQEEIDNGKREPNTGLLYGLYDPKKVEQVAMMAAPVDATVGDGGASWKAKMLQRAKDRARETGQSLESVVQAQYGMDLQMLEEQARGARMDAHLHYKRHRDSDQQRRRDASSSGGDKSLIEKYNKRIERSGLSSSALATSSGDKEGAKQYAEDDEEPIDYSKLPDSDDDTRRRGQPVRRRDDRNRRRSRDRSRDRTRRRLPSPRRRSRSRSRRSPSPVNSEPEEEAKRRAAFLYGSLTAPRATPIATEEIAVVEEASTQAPTSVLTEEVPRLESGAIDLNQLAARALKAKMRGDLVNFERFTAQLNEAERDEIHASAPAMASRQRARVPMRPEDLKPGSKKGKRSTVDSGAHLSLEELVRNERNAPDMDSVHAQNVMRLGTRYNHSDVKGASASGLDEEDAVDMRLYRDAKDRLTERAFVQSSERQMLKSRMQWDTAMQRCWFCMKSESFKKHLMIAMGEYAYVALPSAATIVPGQCIIAPMEHLASTTAADENTVAEIERFKKALRSMWAASGSAVVFLETTMDPAKKRHTVIECVPVPLQLEPDVPMYFKQGLVECDEEWATHKKVIDTTEKGLQRSIPPQFAYFHVEWSNGGYGHIIEDAAQFPKDFGMDILSGILEVDPRRYGKYHASFDAEKDRVRDFLAMWQPFDWTQELDGGEYAT